MSSSIVHQCHHSKQCQHLFSMPPSSEAQRLITHLKSILLDLHRHPYPYVANPPNLKKRASVALIIRINPSYSQWPQPHDYTSPADQKDQSSRIEEYLSRDWVKQGDPEILFIKRAARVGDRWTGHVALPGGRRDPEDADDYAAAVRETSEEVGIDLDSSNAISVGNLPQRLVTASWGTKPLMILCPYIFLLTSPPPRLRLQPTEVASAHWVPIRYLLHPSMRTYESADVSARLSNQAQGTLYSQFLRHSLGSMLFSAVKLVPTETVFCPDSPGFGPELTPPPPQTKLQSLAAIPATLTQYTKSLLTLSSPATSSTDRPLLLWGLTLGVIADFLELLPPHDALSLWTYPTFSAPDVRLAIWGLSYRFRTEKARKLAEARRRTGSAGADGDGSGMAEIEVGMDSVPLPQGRRLSRSIMEAAERVAEEAEPSVVIGVPLPEQHDDNMPQSPQDRFLAKQEGADVERIPTSPPPEVGIAGLGASQPIHTGRSSDGTTKRERRSSRSSRVGFMLEGYYDIMRRAVALALLGRAAALVAIISWIVAAWRRRRRRRMGLL